MRIGLLGGSFDPVHAGHVEPALAARAQLGLERVVFLPTAVPPHKPGRRFAPALARYAMVELALLDHAELVVSDRELTRAEPAYTVDTLVELRQAEPAAELVLLLGADSLAQLHTWRRWEEILSLATVAVLPRAGADRASLTAGAPPALTGALAQARVEWVAHPPHPASATEIRRRLAAGEPVPDGWLARRVLAFIAKYGLYR
jgi:nicotinate-nucleotide adenylyltransferase